MFCDVFWSTHHYIVTTWLKLEFFSQRSATKSVRKSKKELRRSSGLRGAGKSTPRDPGGRKRRPGSANPCPPTASPDGAFARLLRTSRKTGRTYTPRKRNGEGSEGEPRREKGPEGGLLVYNATATPQPPRGAGGAPEA